tara:strand:+ start:252 stop:578 length:327 start_codon:yes stop_codon:yes gene_type:complete
MSASVYVLNLKGGKKYVGYSKNPKKRIKEHFEGNGAQVTKDNKPTSIHTINKCKSIQSAKNAETKVYYNMKNYYGKNNVRGAGNTKGFNKITCYKCGKQGHYANTCYS